MNKIVRSLMLLMVCVIGLSAAGCSRVPSGYVGVKVYLLGGAKGVDQEEVGVGRYWIGMNEQLFLFPTFTQNYVWTADAREGSPTDESITFQTVEGMAVGADVGISYRIDPTKVSIIFQKYRRGIDEITDTFLRNMVRDAFVKVASTREVEYVYGKGKAEILDAVTAMVRNQVAEQGIIVENIYLIGELRLPDAVTTSINNKIKATQQAQQRENEVREAEAEANKIVAKADGDARAITAVAKAQADANKILNASLTPELVKYKAIEKWDGKLPQVTSGDTGMLLNMDIKK